MDDFSWSVDCCILPQIEPNRLLNSSRYNHQLVTWDNQLLAVGGNMDDSNGKSAKVVSVIALDLNTRTWSSIKNLTPPTSKDGTEGGAGTPLCVICVSLVSACLSVCLSIHFTALTLLLCTYACWCVCMCADNYMFEAATVSGDYLLTAFQVISGSGEDTGRKYLSLDLTTQEVDGTFDLVSGGTEHMTQHSVGRHCFVFDIISSHPVCARVKLPTAVSLLCTCVCVCAQFDGPLMLDWPLVAILSLTDDGSPPHLVMQAKREMPSATNKAITWYGE